MRATLVRSCGRPPCGRFWSALVGGRHAGDFGLVPTTAYFSLQWLAALRFICREYSTIS
jgi:hypothetical protein